MMPRADITVRGALPSDLAALAALEASVLDGWSEQSIASALSSPTAHLLVAHSGNAVCGFAAWTLVAPEANLDTLTVAAAHRRCGIAQALLAASEQALAAQGAAALLLEVRSQNTAARALYAKLGWRQNGMRRNFYQNPADDAILMEKTL